MIRSVGTAYIYPSVVLISLILTSCGLSPVSVTPAGVVLDNLGFRN